MMTDYLWFCSFFFWGRAYFSHYFSRLILQATESLVDSVLIQQKMCYPTTLWPLRREGWEQTKLKYNKICSSYQGFSFFLNKCYIDFPKLWLISSCEKEDFDIFLASVSMFLWGNGFMEFLTPSFQKPHPFYSIVKHMLIYQLYIELRSFDLDPNKGENKAHSITFFVYWGKLSFMILSTNMILVLC